jgi:GNAT superfamily N-acetyltransferase
VNEPEPAPEPESPRRRTTAVRIRRARPSDAPTCAAVMRAAIRAIPPGVHPRRALAAWASLPPLYHRWAMGVGGETYLLATGAGEARGARRAGQPGRVLGYAALRGGELTAVFVRPRAQGQGVGRALVRAAAIAARRDGHRALRVLAARAAVRFYAALGFRGAARARAPLPGGLSLVAVRMRRSLAR